MELEIKAHGDDIADGVRKIVIFADSREEMATLSALATLLLRPTSPTIALRVKSLIGEPPQEIGGEQQAIIGTSIHHGPLNTINVVTMIRDGVHFIEKDCKLWTPWTLDVGTHNDDAAHAHHITFFRRKM